MDIRLRFILIALGIIAVVVIVATLLLPRKVRLGLYVALILIAGGAWAYVTLSREYLPSSYAVETTITGLQQPTFGAAPPDGSGRLFVTSKLGIVQVVKDGEVLNEPLIDIGDQVAWEGGEQGLLSLAFHPEFQENGFFYLYYTAKPDDRTVLSRFQISAEDPDFAPAESETILMEIPQINPHHNGGHLAFGPDGYLYLSVGNGGQERWPDPAQDLSDILGSMLRLDVSDPGADPPYRIPPDNPYVDDSEARPEIWASGLRQPWRFDFDSVSGDLYITDVGAQTKEEVNYQQSGQGAGANYGWIYYEGTSKFMEDREVPADLELTFPVAEYDHLGLGGCSITGGFVYRGQALPDLIGKYIYGDFCSGFVWSLEMDGDKANVDRLLRAENLRLASFAEDGDGELYLVDLAGGTLNKMVAD